MLSIAGVILMTVLHYAHDSRVVRQSSRDAISAPLLNPSKNSPAADEEEVSSGMISRKFGTGLYIGKKLTAACLEILARCLLIERADDS